MTIYKKIKKHIVLSFCLLICISFSFAQSSSLYEHKEFVSNSDTLQYRILYPKNFSENIQYPVVLFLHGSGERGSDNNKQLIHGSKLFLNDMNRGAFPAIVVFPQCPQSSYWSNVTVDRSTNSNSLVFPLDAPPTRPLSMVIELMEEFLGKPYVDKNRIYVGGLSMGGKGTFELLYRRPNMFAAAFTICGGSNPEMVKAYASKTELWVFHGAKDDIVDPQFSIQMVAAYLSEGGKPNFTLYAHDDHNSWDSAFAEPKLLPWLFSKSKN